MEDFGIISEDNGGTSPALDKVRKLLAKAESTNSDAERDALNAKAAAMIAKYGIDMAMAGVGHPSADEMALKEWEIRGEYADEIARLLVGLADALGCEGILTYEGATVVGFMSDMERMEVLYTSLQLQMHSGALRQTARRSWMLGFTVEVVSRVRLAEGRAREEAGGDGSCTALVLADRKSRVTAAFKEEFPVVKYSTPRVNRSAFAAGIAAGRTADIGGKRVGNSRQAIG